MGLTQQQLADLIGTTQSEGLERQLAELVNRACGLTPEEVALMWDTVPPRMPGGW